MAELLEIRRSLAAVVRGFDPAVVLASDAALVVREAVRIKNLATTLETLAAGRVAESGLWKQKGYRSPADWLATESKERAGDVIGVIETALVLDACPATAAKARAGELSGPQTRALAKAVSADPGAEARLLGVAERDGLKKLVDQCRQTEHAGAGEHARHERIRRNRHLRHWTDGDGAFCLAGSFPPVAGAKLLGALAPFEKQAFEQARRDDRRERPDAYRADALEAMCDAILAGTGTGTGSDATATAPRTRKPAFVAVIDAKALKRGHAEAGERCEIAGVGPVSVTALRQSAPEAVWHAVVSDGIDVLAYASMKRHIPDWLKLCLAVRDPECVVPGCNQTHSLEYDHVTPYAHGGPTAAHNLAPLCPHDHAQKTHDHYTLTRDPNGQWHWHPPPNQAPDTS